MNPRRTFVIVALASAVGGCAGAATSSSTNSPSAALGTTPTSPSAVAPSPLVTASATSAPPVPTPVPTLASTSKVATKAPKGAINVVMTVIDPDHGLPVYQPNSLTAKAGTVVFFLVNVPPAWATVDHNMWIGPSIGAPLAGSTDVTSKEKVILTVHDLTAGSYVFWCTIAAPDGNTHASYGMVGTLTITP